MCFAVIELPKTLWGCGNTRKEAVSQARNELSDYTHGSEELRITRRKEPRAGDFIVLRCTTFFKVHSEYEHGGRLDLRISGNRVLLPEEFNGLKLIHSREEK
ncbi:MAG: hypothetical protein AB2689_06085 [Candidatus Thiodiazotropha taylori]